MSLPLFIITYTMQGNGPVHCCWDPLGKEIQKFWVRQLAGTALASRSVWYQLKVSETPLSSFIGKKVRFLGLILVILLSKMKDRAGYSWDFILIWQLPIAIYEGFLKVVCLLLLAEAMAI